MSGYRATLLFEDGHESIVDVPCDANVLAAALDAGLSLTHQCTSGSCGTCGARLTQGKTRTVSGRTLSLLPSEYEEGGRLLCSTVLDSDACFVMPYPSDVIFGPQPVLAKAVVAAVERLSASVVRLDVELTDEQKMGYAAGQYARVRVPRTDAWRSYSMAATPRELPTLSFLIRLLDEGVMTDYLRGDVETGHELEIELPLGSFILREGAERYIMVAGGTGLAPIIAMLDEIRASRRGKPEIVVCFACQTDDDLFYADELELRAFWMPGLDLRIAVTEPERGGWPQGTPVSLLRPDDVSAAAEAYVCGPPGMIDAARAQLRTFGLDETHIHAEQFVPSDV